MVVEWEGATPPTFFGVCDKSSYARLAGQVGRWFARLLLPWPSSAWRPPAWLSRLRPLRGLRPGCRPQRMGLQLPSSPSKFAWVCSRCALRSIRQEPSAKGKQQQWVYTQFDDLAWLC
jgi:hypothetical protein